MRNNRTAGHAYELAIRKWWIARGWTKCQTSRYASREMDDKKVDLMATDPFYVQCKYTQTINMHTILSQMPEDTNMNIIFHKRKSKGTVVAMKLEDFEEIVNMLKGVL